MRVRVRARARVRVRVRDRVRVRVRDRVRVRVRVGLGLAHQQDVHAREGAEGSRRAVLLHRAGAGFGLRLGL